LGSFLSLTILDFRLTIEKSQQQNHTFSLRGEGVPPESFPQFGLIGFVFFGRFWD